jgi:hypothetical protein
MEYEPDISLIGAGGVVINGEPRHSSKIYRNNSHGPGFQSSFTLCPEIEAVIVVLSDTSSELGDFADWASQTLLQELLQMTPRVDVVDLARAKAEKCRYWFREEMIKPWRAIRNLPSFFLFFRADDDWQIEQCLSGMTGEYKNANLDRSLKIEAHPLLLPAKSAAGQLCQIEAKICELKTCTKSTIMNTVGIQKACMLEIQLQKQNFISKVLPLGKTEDELNRLVNRMQLLLYFNWEDDSKANTSPKFEIDQADARCGGIVCNPERRQATPLYTYGRKWEHGKEGNLEEIELWSFFPGPIISSLTEMAFYAQGCGGSMRRAEQSLVRVHRGRHGLVQGISVDIGGSLLTYFGKIGQPF